MDRIIEVKVFGNHLTKDSKTAGTKGEANVTRLRITFDEGWDYYEKEIIFWDAYGGNAVKRVITTDLYEDATKSTRVYLVPIPAEAMARAGLLTFIIQGALNGKKQVSIESKLEVKDSPDILEPIDPTPTQAAQLQMQIEAIKDDIQDVAIARNEAAESAKNAKENAEKAEEAVGKSSYIGENGNWYAWDGEKGEFYDTGVKAQAGSTVYCGDNPPDEADVWVDPDGVADAYTRGEVDNLIAEINTQMDTLDEEKADKSTTLAGYGITDAYTKKESDAALETVYATMNFENAKKADKASTLEGYGISNAYTKGQSDQKFQDKLTDEQLQNVEDVQKKADKSTTLAGYGITDALSKGEAAQGFGAIDERLTNHYYTNEQSDGKFQEKLTSVQLQNISDVAKKADATDVEKLESDVKALGDNKAEMSYVRNQFANALKGTASGEAVGLHDVSPIEHTMAVKVRSKNPDVADVTTATVKKYGANILDVANAPIYHTNAYNTSYSWERTATGYKSTVVTGNENGSSRVGFYIGTTDELKGKTITASGNFSGVTEKALSVISTNVEGTLIAKGGQTAQDKDYEVGRIVSSNIQTLTSKVAIDSITFTIPETTTYPYIAVCFYCGLGKTTVGDVSEWSNIQIQIGNTVAEYEPYKEPTIYTPSADGTVEGVTSLYPSTTLLTDTEGVVIDCEYNRDINKAFEELMQAINTLGGND